jgi:hypothetical protein
MKREFGDILNDSWNEFKGSWRLFLKVFLLFYVLPFIIIFAISFPLQLQIQEEATLLEQEVIGFNEVSDSFWKYTGIIFALSIIGSFFYLFVSSCFYYHIIYSKGKKNYNKMISGGKKYFWRYFGLILMYILIFLLFMVVVSGLVGILVFIFMSNKFLMALSVSIAIILSILLMIKYFIGWMLAPYFLINENNKIVESLRNSFNLVKGRWWTVFLYVFLFGLIVFIINIIAGVIGLAIFLPFKFLILNSPSDSTLGAIGSLIDSLFSLIVTFITIPLGIILFKNVYLELKGEKDKKKSKKKPVEEKENKKKKKSSKKKK